MSDNTVLRLTWRIGQRQPVRRVQQMWTHGAVIDRPPVIVLRPRHDTHVDHPRAVEHHAQNRRGFGGGRDGLPAGHRRQSTSRRWAPVAALWAAAAVVLPLPVAAQHPCDLEPPTAYRVPRVTLPDVRIGFCFARGDATGATIMEPVGFTLSIDDGPPIDLGFLQAHTGPNATGAQYYEAAVALTPGVVTIQAYTSLGMSAPSAPVTLTATGPKS